MKRSVSLVLAGLFSMSAWGADLMSVYQDALNHDARFTAAKAARVAGQEKVVQGRAGLLPGIGASASTTWNQNTYTGTDRNFNSNTVGVQLRQPLFNWGSWVQYREGELQTALSEAQFELARQDLILRVSQAYFNVLNAQDSLASLKALHEAAGQQLALAKKSFEVGTVTITDVHEAQSRFDLSSAQVIAAENTLEVARQTLAQIIGDVPEGVQGLREGASLAPPEPSDINPWVDAAQQQSFGVQIQQIATDIAEREVSRNRAGHLPTVDLVANYGQSNAGATTFGSNRSEITSRSIGLELNVPIYQGGGVSSRTREAAALLVKSQAELDDARRSAALSARQAYLGVTNGLAQVRALEAARVSSRSALEANQLGYEVGVRINIDVLNAQSQLADTEQQLAKARYDTLLAQLRLKAAVGTLGEEDVAQLNALLTQ
ncbi:TolC family outer membrane protein [Nitrogeniibacter mangrovi]|uniref:TolC family outer membrane protein n=1 Tax=Nitrogeniibacter mangrovi TaxID=2016596 RepID=A0A6C1B441_9RHOO|nr:TolC family outer membrane protein [Nitrogeniibacter mangrovi]QID16964.1 TolC family outer membrane protein [Nitrogeniibacter mangrovi]